MARAKAVVLLALLVCGVLEPASVAGADPDPDGTYALPAPTKCNPEGKLYTRCNPAKAIRPGSTPLTKTFQDCRKLVCSKVTGAEYFSWRAKTRTCTCLTDCSEYVILTTNAPDDLFFNGLTKCPAGEGDPQFLGADGTHFDFNGVLGKSFCLLTDKSLHVNAFFDGYVKHHKIKSWMKDVSVSWKTPGGTMHKIELFARRGKDQRRGEHGFVARITLDGKDVPVPTKVGDKVSGDGGFNLVLERVGEVVKRENERDTFSLTIEGLLEMEMSINPEYGANQTPDDAEIHFNFNFPKVQVTKDVHGVLGQTFKPGLARLLRATQYKALAAIQKKRLIADGPSGAGFLDGLTRDYATSGLNKTDCKFATAWNTV